MLDEPTRLAMNEFAQGLNSLDWTVDNLSTHMKTVLKAHNLKMPKLAMPLRVMLTGITQTPSIDKVMALMGQSIVMQRIEAGLAL